MSAIAESAAAFVDDRVAKRNALVLAIAQGLSGGNNAVIVSTGGIVGAMLAPERGFATLSITMMVIGMWAGTLPLGWLAAKYGRRFALQTGTAVGVAAGLISCAAVLASSFALFCFGAFCGGLYASAHQSYRFAAADTASEHFRPKAISWVLTGGVAASIIGPQLIIFTQNLWPPYLFAASYIGQAIFAALAGCVLILFKNPPPAGRRQVANGRPLWEIVRTRRFIVAVACGVAAYAMMNLVMTSAPLAMVDCGHSVTNATLGLQWHMIAMFAPSFFTGKLILRFGLTRVILAGLALIGASAVISVSGITVAHFWIGLILLGLGWNFAFIGATTLVTQCHRPEERNKVQAFNDFLIFGSMAAGSFASGKILASLGWVAVNEVVLPAVLAAAALLIWLALRERRQPA
ncbi:MAG TPA: MFS transporter [Xanthobacteraceae bacterium]|nr:MFS transporter [Xanthobacteraceae bacterium]